MASEPTTSVRINKILTSEATRIADEKNISTKTYLDEIISKANDEYNYSFEKLKEHISKSISLSVYKDTIEKEFNDAPVGIRKRIIHEISHKKVYFFYNKFPEEEEKIKHVLGNKIGHAILIVKIKGDGSSKPPKELDQLSNILSKINFPKKTEIEIIVKNGCDIKEDGFELIGFVTLKKEGEDDTG